MSEKTNIIRPKDGEQEPSSGWVFYYDSIEYPIGPDYEYDDDLAAHAVRYFTTIRNGSQYCMVDVETQEAKPRRGGGQTTQKVFDCPIKGCRHTEKTWDAIARHIRDCVGSGVDK